MRRFFRNPWTWILLPPIVLFILMAGLAVAADLIALTFGLLVFLAAALVAGKYVIRAPALIYSGSVANQSINIVGWSLVLLSLMASQVLRWVAINLSRPDWLTQQYWSPAIVYTLFIGFVLVAWSTRKASTAPPGGRIGLGGWFVGFLSGVGLMLSGIFPVIIKGLTIAWHAAFRMI